MHTQMSQRLSFMRMIAPFFHWRSTPLCLMSCNALWWSFMTGPALPLMSTRLDENFSPKRIGRWKIFPHRGKNLSYAIVSSIPCLANTERINKFTTGRKRNFCHKPTLSVAYPLSNSFYPNKLGATFKPAERYSMRWIFYVGYTSTKYM